MKSAKPIGIHETPELRSLEAKLRAQEAAIRELEQTGQKTERSARRWRFATVGLVVVLALVGARRR